MTKQYEDQLRYDKALFEQYIELEKRAKSAIKTGKSASRAKLDGKFENSFNYRFGTNVKRISTPHAW